MSLQQKSNAGGCGVRDKGKRTSAKKKERKFKVARKSLEGKKLTKKAQKLYNRMFKQTRTAGSRKTKVYNFGNKSVVIREDVILSVEEGSAAEPVKVLRNN